MNEQQMISDRELYEIRLALLYENYCNHGTAGHNRLSLIAKLAKNAGYSLDQFEGRPALRKTNEKIHHTIV